MTYPAYQCPTCGREFRLKANNEVPTAVMCRSCFGWADLKEDADANTHVGHLRYPLREQRGARA